MKPFFQIFILAAQPLLSQAIVSVTQIGQLTGQPSMNNTGAVNVYGTDLGSMFLHSDGHIYFLFGDTFGPPGPPDSSGDWRSNTMAYTSDTTASDGIIFDGWITDSTGQAQALVEGDHDPNDGSGEVTKIPTAGWSFQGRQYLWFMSVKQWLDPGQWEVNYAEIAYSDDNGNTWLSSGMQRPGDSHFIQVAVAEYEDSLYFWGIPAGRYGGVTLSRVSPSHVLDSTAYEYFNGAGWSTNEAEAMLIVEPPVGELSVVWNPYLQRWLMMYLNDNTDCIEARLAEQPQGPWEDPMTVVCADQYPGLYGAFMHSRYLENNGETVYFLMSQYGSYNVFLMKVVFQQTEANVNEPLSYYPHPFTLYQNYPNPFNGHTWIKFDLPTENWVTLNVFDIRGQQIRTLVDRVMIPGRFTITWDGKDDHGVPVGSGIYFFSISTGEVTQSQRTLYLK